MRSGRKQVIHPIRIVPSEGNGPPSAGAVDFAESVRLVAFAAKSNGLSVPAFRSPPRISGVDRSLTRSPSGEPVVSIRLGERPLAAVQADLIDSVLHVNQPPPEVARRFRASAWEALSAVVAGPPLPAAPRAQVSPIEPPQVA